METWDDEIEETLYSAFFTREEAQEAEEVESAIHAAPQTLVMTEKLQRLCNQPRRSIISTRDFLLIAFAEFQNLDESGGMKRSTFPPSPLPEGEYFRGSLPIGLGNSTGPNHSAAEAAAASLLCLPRVEAGGG